MPLGTSKQSSERSPERGAGKVQRSAVMRLASATVHVSLIFRAHTHSSRSASFLFVVAAGTLWRRPGAPGTPARHGTMVACRTFHAATHDAPPLVGSLCGPLYQRRRRRSLDQHQSAKRKIRPRCVIREIQP